MARVAREQAGAASFTGGKTVSATELDVAAAGGSRRAGGACIEHNRCMGRVCGVDRLGHAQVAALGGHGHGAGGGDARTRTGQADLQRLFIFQVQARQIGGNGADLVGGGAQVCSTAQQFKRGELEAPCGRLTDAFVR